MDPELRDVVDLELRLLDPDVRRRPDAVDSLLDPEFREFGASGTEWDRASIRDMLRDDDGYVPPDVEDLRAVRLAPDVVLLTYTARRPDRTTLRSAVWRRRDGGPWRVFFHQGTPRT